MHLLIKLALILSLLLIALLGVSNIERELLKPPPRGLGIDGEGEDY
jgi:hypothetical protein